MSTLISKLTSQHHRLLGILEEIKRMEFQSADFQKANRELKMEWEAHSKVEDMHLYPELRCRAESENGLRVSLNVMAQDLDKVNLQLGDLFAKAEDPGLSKMEWVRLFARVETMLKTRVRREEETLYVEYDKK